MGGDEIISQIERETNNQSWNVTWSSINTKRMQSWTSLALEGLKPTTEINLSASGINTLGLLEFGVLLPGVESRWEGWWVEQKSWLDRMGQMAGLWCRMGCHSMVKQDGQNKQSEFPQGDHPLLMATGYRWSIWCVRHVLDFNVNSHNMVMADLAQGWTPPLCPIPFDVNSPNVQNVSSSGLNTSNRLNLSESIGWRIPEIYCPLSIPGPWDLSLFKTLQNTNTSLHSGQAFLRSHRLYGTISLGTIAAGTKGTLCSFQLLVNTVFISEMSPTILWLHFHFTKL